MMYNDFLFLYTSAIAFPVFCSGDLYTLYAIILFIYDLSHVDHVARTSA